MQDGVRGELGADSPLLLCSFTTMKAAWLVVED